jgi:hypothetical protein
VSPLQDNQPELDSEDDDDDEVGGDDDIRDLLSAHLAGAATIT